MEKPNYTYVSYPNPHVKRGREILKRHPKVRGLMGPNPYSALAILGLVGLQIGMAFVLRNQSWPVILLVSYLFGAFPNHALYVMIHECAHNLVFKKSWPNKIMGILCDIPLILPSAMGFRNYHLLHHQHLGEFDYDADLVDHWEAKAVGNSPLKKALWLAFFFLSQGIFRPMRLNKVKFWNIWSLYNLIFQLGINLILFSWLGPKALAYLFFSTFWALGLHPLGGRWIQEHYITNPPQETYSYYGPLNKLCFNMGYHNEHHDLMTIPWNRLPKLKAMAPEFYSGLISYKSWAKVLWRFIFDPKLSPYSRIVHPSKAKLSSDKKGRVSGEQIFSEGHAPLFF